MIALSHPRNLSCQISMFLIVEDNFEFMLHSLTKHGTTFLLLFSTIHDISVCKYSQHIRMEDENNDGLYLPLHALW